MNDIYWQKYLNKSLVLMGKSNFQHRCCKCIWDIRRYREKCGKIIYLDETLVDIHITFKKCWSNESGNFIKTLLPSLLYILSRLIIVHARSDKGFVTNACLIFKAGPAQGDYHGQMNHKNFIR